MENRSELEALEAQFASDESNALNTMDASAEDLSPEQPGQNPSDSWAPSAIDPKLRVVKTAFWLSLVLSIPAVLISPSLQALLHLTVFQVPFAAMISAAIGAVIFALAWPTIIWPAVKEVRLGRPQKRALNGLAVIGAFLYSAVLAVLGMVAPGNTVEDYWWSFGLITAAILASNWLRTSLVNGIFYAVDPLGASRPREVEVVVGEEIRKRPLEDLAIGDTLLVRAESLVPADGILLTDADVNELALWGRNQVTHKAEGEIVFAGSWNAGHAKDPADVTIHDLLQQDFTHEAGSFRFKVTALPADALLARTWLLRIQARAQASRVENMSNRIAGWMFWFALGGGLLTATLWLWLGHESLTFGIERFIAILALTSPDAIALVAPAAASVAIHNAQHSGLIVHNREAFEKAGRVKTVVFDKTGTLTTGERTFADAKITRRGGLENVDELLAVAAGIEYGNSHAISNAILAETYHRGIIPIAVKDVMAIPGIGLSGRFEEYRLSLGGPGLLTRQRIEIDVQDLYAADAMNAAGNTVIYVLRDTILLGYIALADQIRAESADAIWEVHNLPATAMLLSSDAHGVARTLSDQLKLDEVFAEVLPHEKAAVIARLQESNGITLLAGNGLTDSPELAQADIGVAFDAGLAAANLGCDVAVIGSNPSSVPSLIRQSKVARGKTVLGLVWVALLQLLMLLLAAGILWSAGTVFPPVLAALLSGVCTLIAALNAKGIEGVR